MPEPQDSIAKLREQIARGQLDAARWPLDKLLKRYPEHPQVLAAAALWEFRGGNRAAAMDVLKAAIKKFPSSANLREDFGMALAVSGDRAGAIQQLRTAIQIDPNLTSALEHASDILFRTDAWEECERYLRRLTLLCPDRAKSWNNLGMALVRTGELDEAEEVLRRAQLLAPDDSSIGSQLAMIANYRDDRSPAELLAIHRQWNDRYGSRQPVLASTFEWIDRSPDRRLRIGYVSGDFRAHVVSKLFEPILSHHDKQNFEVFCYSASKFIDDVTRRLQSQASGWREIHQLSDVDALQQIRDDRIDILIDLSGHTTGNRLTLFALQPAPIQFTYLGYPNTTGVPAIQYRITDAVADPAGLTDALHTETLVRLPDCFLCYQPRASAPATLDETPARKTGSICFASFNGLTKLTDAMIRIWAKVLGAVPGSRLMIQAGGLSTPRVQQRFRKLFDECHLPTERVELRSWVDPSQRDAVVASADIALDSFPYTGTVTTFETLWMGAPVITLAGNTHVSRVSASILTTIGCPELIAISADEYVAKTVALATDLSRLDEYRRTLRGRMSASSVLDPVKLTANLEAIYRQAWHRWVSGASM